MHVQTLEISSQADAAYDTIKRRIRTCEILPGARITEKQLAQELGYSKTPVREALARLVSDNFVRVLPRSGYQVTTLTLRDFEEVFAVSRLIWPPMMALAAERSSVQSIERLRARENREADNWIEEARLVLQAAANATGNQRLADISMRLYDEMERFFSLALRFHPLPPTKVELEAWIFDAFLRRDTTEVSRRVSELIETMYRDYLEILRSLPSILESPLV